METRIYQKENNLSVFKLLKASLKDIYGSRFLAKQITVRDIKAQYRQSYFGILWAFIMPLTTAFVWIFLSSSGTVKLSDTDVPYPVFVFSGTLLWSVLRQAINTPAQSTQGARGLLSKINFPKEALVVSGVYKLLFDTSFKMGLLLVLMLIYGMPFQWGLLLFPLSLLVIILVGIAIGLLLTPFSMLYTDVGKVVSLGLSFIMYITPVVYVVPPSGMMKTLMELNPFTALITVTRDVLLGGDFVYLSYFGVIFLITIPVLALALVWYRLSIPVIVERN
ncbi:ABC transporter permease [Tamlana flava]|uniref:ABC transporter permease n=1 Tax=Tamlana flava TaxID=3158572 RepID=UPI00351B4943